MTSRRLAAVALMLLAFAGCNNDPTVVSAPIAPAAQALVLLSTGGAASSVPGTDGTGGAGGDFRATTTGLLSLGSASSVPAVPTTPVAPNAGAFTVATPLSTTTQPGTILIPGSVTTATTTPVVVTSSNGDIVVSGTLQSGDTGTAQVDIQLLAPHGTVYVNGSILTAGSDAASNGRAGGMLTISAARVVITGTIDTHGVSNTTVIGANGGKGGDVDISSTQGPIFLTGGLIQTRGGN
ncbi:MAG TPA: hypothetical protein VKW04_15530, partial [Planctomycetota bacterium]|nr:hypothetical protein [Planctomycetota bacterium]